jgi:hypothetical protein
MNFRTFAYQFKFIPKNQEEFNSAKEIINTFRAHMHPERTDDFFIMYPSQFSIEYQYKGQRNEFLTKIADCALVNMKVDYGSGGALTTFKGTLGAPSEITMTLQFKELELLTRDHFDGYEKGANDNAQKSGVGENAEDSSESKDKIDSETEEEANVEEAVEEEPKTAEQLRADAIAKYNSDLDDVTAQIVAIKADYDAERDGAKLNDLIRQQSIINENLNRLGGGSSKLTYRESSAG